MISESYEASRGLSLKLLFEIHHMPQIFARPRTPQRQPLYRVCLWNHQTIPSIPGAFFRPDPGHRLF